MAPRKIAKKETETVTETVTETNTAATTEVHVGDLVYDRTILDTVFNGTAEAGFASVPVADTAKLVELGLITINPNGAGEDGNIQAIVTDKGKEAHAFNHSEEGKAEAADPVAKKSRRKSDVVTPEATVSTVEVPMPAPGKRGRTGEKYPFGQLAKGQSFHITTTELNEAQAKEVLSRLTSSVSTANTRYAEIDHPIDQVKAAKFIARQVGATDPEGAGVRVWRTA